MQGMARQAVGKLASIWSATGFSADELTRYADVFMSHEVRRGVMTLGIVSLLLLAGAAALYQALGFSPMYLYTCGLLGLLALHVTLSSRTVKQTDVLYLLSMTLLIVSGSAFVLLAHQTGSLGAALLSSVVLLFMVVPMVPWGLREATAVVVMIYLVFTLSTLSVEGRFDAQSLWILQFLMFGSAVATLTIVARNVGVRKNEIKARFELENAHQRMERLSYEDGLTGAWNRRFLDVQFNRLLRRYREQNRMVNFALLDVDDFKQLNDSMGHACGDDVLQALVKVFRAHIGDKNYVFRVGGDEFAVLFDAQRARECLATAATELSGRMQEKIGEQGEPVRLSIGIVQVDESCESDLDILYKEADKALYLAKSQKQTSQAPANLVHRVCTGIHRKEGAS